MPNEIFMREKLFTYWMNSSKTLDENIDEFKKLISWLNQSGEKIETQSESTILLNSLAEAYKEVKSVLKYGRGRDSITVDSIISATKCNELEFNNDFKTTRNGESLFTKTKLPFKRGKLNKPKVFKHKGNFKCFLCHKEGHFKRNYPEMKKKDERRPKEFKKNNNQQGESSFGMINMAI